MKLGILVLISITNIVSSTENRKVFGYEILKDFPSECWDAKKIDDETRRFDKPKESYTSTETDNNLKPGWYWFQGGSGNVLKEGYDHVLKTDQTAPNFCSTILSGTLMGSHPTEEEGIVEMTVCFRKRDCYKEKTNCECTNTQTIFVRNCRRHYIYFLLPTKTGERYCTNEIPMPSKDAPIDTSKVTECQQNKELPKEDSTRDTRLWDVIEDVRCDGDLVGWYRFQDKEGSEMASECLENQNLTRSTRFRQPCGANFRGWMVDRHPTVEEGRVQRRVCFSYDNRCYCEFYTNIGVRNCGNYYVYRLNSVPSCQARYCGAPTGKKSKDTDFKKPGTPGPFDLCKDYQSQYDPDRLWSYTSPTVKKCDSNLYGKYRFGSRYTPWRIKEGCNREKVQGISYRCGSEFHGYMIGKHPVVREGYVERVICFEHNETPCECKHTTIVGVQNCGSYFVYYLKGVPTCSSRYCMVANNSASIRLNPALPPLYEIPTPNNEPVVAKVENKKDDDGTSGLVSSVVALSILLLILTIIILIIIVIIIIKLLPAYRRDGRRTPSYASSVNELPPPGQSKAKPPSPQPTNGELPKEPEQIPPYPSVLPEQAAPGDMKDIPEDLEISDDDGGDDCDTLMKKEDMHKPQSYDNLPSKDSAV